VRLGVAGIRVFTQYINEKKNHKKTTQGFSQATREGVRGQKFDWGGWKKNGACMGHSSNL